MLVYTSKVLSQGITIMGQIRVRVSVASSSSSADISLKLNVITPDGRCLEIAGALHRHSFEVGVARELYLVVGSSAMEFKVGERIQLEISSSNFPQYELNGTPSVQTIHWGGTASSCISLPQVENMY
jgi:predicted acyl esterase